MVAPRLSGIKPEPEGGPTGKRVAAFRSRLGSALAAPDGRPGREPTQGGAPGVE